MYNLNWYISLKLYCDNAPLLKALYNKILLNWVLTITLLTATVYDEYKKGDGAVEKPKSIQQALLFADKFSSIHNNVIVACHCKQC